MKREQLQQFDQEFACAKALATIKTHELYRNYGETFETYCKKRWTLPRSTAALKVAIGRAYRFLESAVKHRCIGQEDLPKHESHLRPILSLPRRQLVKVWHETINTCRARNTPVTMAAVKRTLQQQNADAHTAFHRYLTPDTTFPGIAFRLDMANLTPGGSAQQVTGGQSVSQFTADEWDRQANFLRQLPLLEDHTPLQYQPVVLVSPSKDLFDGSVPYQYTHALLSVLTRMSSYRFLIWTTPHTYMNIRRYGASHIEPMIQVRNARDMDEFQIIHSQLDQVDRCAVWVLFGFIATLPKLTITRVVLSYDGPLVYNHWRVKELSALLVSGLREQYPIHLSRPFCDLFAQEDHRHHT